MTAVLEQEPTTAIKARSSLIDYFVSLQKDLDVPYPTVISQLTDSGIDFEVNCLFKYIMDTTNCRSPYFMDLRQEDIEDLIQNPNDDVRVSALLSIMDNRIPQLHIRNRV